MRKLLILLLMIPFVSFSQNNLISLFGSYAPNSTIYTGVRYQTDVNSRSSVSISYHLVIKDQVYANFSVYSNDLIELSYNYYLKPKGDYVSSQGLYISPSILLSADFIRNKKNMDFVRHVCSSSMCYSYYYEDFKHIKFGIGPKIGYQWVFNNINLGIDMPWYYMVSDIKETYYIRDNVGDPWILQHRWYNSNGIGYYINLSIGYVF